MANITRCFVSSKFSCVLGVKQMMCACLCLISVACLDLILDGWTWTWMYQKLVHVQNLSFIDHFTKIEDSLRLRPKPLTVYWSRFRYRLQFRPTARLTSWYVPL